MVEERNLVDAKESNLNRSQALIHIINANVTYFAGPRATGKTSGGIGPRVLHLSEIMPRSQIGLVNDTYERIEKSLLPGLEAYWNEELGLLPDVDYVINKKPPDHWTKPLYIPKKWDRVVSFASGFILAQISLAVEGSANGFNLQAVIGDEVKYWNEKKFKSEVKPAIRGGRKYFGHLAEFQSQWFFTDKYPSKGANIYWVLDKKKECNQSHVDIVYTMQLEVYRLEKEMDAARRDNNINVYYDRKRTIKEYETVLNEMRKDLVYYCDALPYENIDVLGGKYYRDQKRDLTTYEYDVAIENKDPDKAIKPFYPDLVDQIFYEDPFDYDPNLPLIIALDYQFSIVPLCATQYKQLNDSAYTTLNFIQSFHVLEPEGIEAVVDKFCKAFETHGTKVVYYTFDQTAIGRSLHGKSFKEIVIDCLTKNNWSVTDIYMGDTPDHDIKYEAIKKLLAVTSDKAIRINKLRNESLVDSLKLAPAVIDAKGKTRKDKSSEKENSGTPPEKATHYSDVFDQILWGALVLEIVPLTDYPGMDIIIGARK
ncbi:MAG: hypothetical protein ABI675_19520 [Chitinophagaceae bacterium]